MTVNEFIRNILGLEEQVVVYFELDIRNRILNLWVKPYKNGYRCPEYSRCCRIAWTDTVACLLWSIIPGLEEQHTLYSE